MVVVGSLLGHCIRDWRGRRAAPRSKGASVDQSLQFEPVLVDVSLTVRHQGGDLLEKVHCFFGGDISSDAPIADTT